MSRGATFGTVPPFGRTVIEARKRGASVNLFLYCGSRCWEKARLREHGIAVPTPTDAQKADWRPLVGGLPGVMLVAQDWDATAVDVFARQLVHDGAKLVTAVRVESDGEVRRVAHAFYRAKERVSR